MVLPATPLILEDSHCQVLANKNNQGSQTKMHDVGSLGCAGFDRTGNWDAEAQREEIIPDRWNYLWHLLFCGTIISGERYLEKLYGFYEAWILSAHFPKQNLTVGSSRQCLMGTAQKALFWWGWTLLKQKWLNLFEVNKAYLLTCFKKKKIRTKLWVYVSDKWVEDYVPYLDNKEGRLVHQRGWYAPLQPMAYSHLHQTNQTRSLSIWFQLC